MIKTVKLLFILSIFSYFPFWFEGRIWDQIASVPDHCLSFFAGWLGWAMVLGSSDNKGTIQSKPDSKPSEKTEI